MADSDSLIFPQHGDEGDAAFFAFLAGTGIRTSAVVSGLGITADFSTDTCTVGRGKALIVEETMTTVATNVDPPKTVDEPVRAIQLPETTGISLDTNAQNTVYLDPRLNTSDSPTVSVNPSTIDDKLKIAEVDTTSETVSDQWFLLSTDGNLTFPDKNAINWVEQNMQLDTGTTLFDRNQQRQYVVSTGGVRLLGETDAGINLTRSGPTIDVVQGDGSGLDADTVDGEEAADLGSNVSDNGTTVTTSATDINFRDNIIARADGDTTSTVDIVNSPSFESVTANDIDVDGRNVSRTFRNLQQQFNELAVELAQTQFENGLNELDYRNGVFDIFVDETRIDTLTDAVVDTSNEVLKLDTTDSGTATYLDPDDDFVPDSAVLSVEGNVPSDATYELTLVDENGATVTIPEADEDSIVDASDIDTLNYEVRLNISRDAGTPTPEIDDFAVYLDGALGSYYDATIDSTTEA